MGLPSALQRLLRRESAPIPLVLYTRPGCHLCDEMKAEIARARPPRRFDLREVNIDGDAALTERFGLSIPVLEIAGQIAFKGRLSAADFERKLARAANER